LSRHRHQPQGYSAGLPQAQAVMMLSSRRASGLNTEVGIGPTDFHQDATDGCRGPRRADRAASKIDLE
jgi:hypothetical protein